MGSSSAPIGSSVGFKRRRTNTGDRLRRAGFDKSRFNRSSGAYTVRCSQCEAAVINGIACHETGCPNARRSFDPR